MTTNVPSPTFGPNGFIVPSEVDVLNGVTADIDAAFGGGVNPALTSPQGQLATSMTAIIGETNDTFLDYTQQVDPAYADGRMQDAIARIYFLERLPSRATVVAATCTGLTGVIIPVGALARATNGLIYTCIQAGEIPDGGSVVLNFACNVVGPVACPQNSLNSIYQAIFGWNTINNLDDGVIGADTESRQAFEIRRAASVAQNSNGSLPSIRGAVLSVSGVLDAYVTENDTNAPLTRGGVLLAANSLYVAVVGGAAQDVAQAIWSRKAPGCSYNGNTTEVVLDQRSGYSPPYPSYNVKFEIPDALPILFEVKIINSTLVPSNATQLIQAAIIAAFSGSDGGARATIGATILASRYYAPVALLGVWAQIQTIKIGSSNAPNSTITASIAGTVMTVTAVSASTLAVGQTLLDVTGNIAVNTKILSLGSGTGGTGTYNVTISQTVASETMTAVRPAADEVDTNIDQVPTISADNINVVLV